MDKTTTGSFVDTEEWVPIHTLPGFSACIEYFINRQGQVKSTKGNIERILKPSTNQQGYPQVSLTQRIGRQKPKKVPIHKLVAFAFLGMHPKPYGRGAGCCVIHHKDEDPSNYCVDNLEWLTASEHRVHHAEEEPKETNNYSEAHKRANREYVRRRRQDPKFLEEEMLKQRERRAAMTPEEKEAQLARARVADRKRRAKDRLDPAKAAKQREYKREWARKKRAEEKKAKIEKSNL